MIYHKIVAIDIRYSHNDTLRPRFFFQIVAKSEPKTIDKNYGKKSYPMVTLPLDVVFLSMVKGLWLRLKNRGKKGHLL